MLFLQVSLLLRLCVCLQPFLPSMAVGTVEVEAVVTPAAEVEAGSTAVAAATAVVITAEGPTGATMAADPTAATTAEVLARTAAEGRTEACAEGRRRWGAELPAAVGLPTTMAVARVTRRRAGIRLEGRAARALVPDLVPWLEDPEARAWAQGQAPWPDDRAVRERQPAPASPTATSTHSEMPTAQQELPWRRTRIWGQTRRSTMPVLPAQQAGAAARDGAVAGDGVAAGDGAVGAGEDGVGDWAGGFPVGGDLAGVGAGARSGLGLPTPIARGGTTILRTFTRTTDLRADCVSPIRRWTSTAKASGLSRLFC